VNTIESVFKIRYGDRAYTDKGILDNGTTPLVASQGVDNGVYGFFDVPIKYHSPMITVPRTGSIGYAFAQLSPCTVTDDCMVLIPKKQMTTEYLFYVATAVRFSRWRFNYARKITPRRLGAIRILPDEAFTPTISYREMVERLYPRRNQMLPVLTSPASFSDFNITDLFTLERGHFHAIDQLEKGHYPTVSRVSVHNGVTGFYQKPAKAKLLPKITLTVSTVTGDAFIQYSQFIATDNVVICIPKNPMMVTTLIYIQALLNKVRWRYSYGRQCYKRNFEKTVIKLPTVNGGRIDESYIENLVTSLPYWKEYKTRLVGQEAK
jgi:restriction endonuclease S subunit